MPKVGHQHKESMDMRTIFVKFGVALALVLTLFIGGVGVTHAASQSLIQPPKASPDSLVCTHFSVVDKPSGGKSASGSGYTLTVYVEFLYDATTHEFCGARGKATVNRGANNLVGGTLTMSFYSCSALVATQNFTVPDGSGSNTYTGVSDGTTCGDTRVGFTATNNVHVPSSGPLDSQNQNA